jgi:selenide,water dikinase
VLVLSKPIGTGILLAGGGEEDKAAAVTRMRTLNRAAAEALAGSPEPPHAVTDVTGFGLLGHAWEMAERSAVTLRIDAGRLPIYAGALEAAEAGVRTGGDARNRAHLEAHVVSRAPAALEALAFDPQTSGGLLAAVTPDIAEAPALPAAGFAVVGEVVAGPAGVELT